MALDAIPRDPKSPSTFAYTVTPHDTNPLPRVSSLYIGTAGNVTLRTVNGTEDVVYKNLANGSYLWLDVLYVRSTGTTAGDIVGEG